MVIINFILHQTILKAYMLMYRQVDLNNNAHFIRTIDLPEHLKKLKQNLQLEEEERERKARYEQELVKVCEKWESKKNFCFSDSLYLQRRTLLGS